MFIVTFLRIQERTAMATANLTTEHSSELIAHN